MVLRQQDHQSWYESINQWGLNWTKTHLGLFKDTELALETNFETIKQFRNRFRLGKMIWNQSGSSKGGKTLVQNHFRPLNVKFHWLLRILFAVKIMNMQSQTYRLVCVWTDRLRSEDLWIKQCTSKWSSKSIWMGSLDPKRICDDSEWCVDDEGRLYILTNFNGD